MKAAKQFVKKHGATNNKNKLTRPWIVLRNVIRDDNIVFVLKDECLYVRPDVADDFLKVYNYDYLRLRKNLVEVFTLVVDGPNRHRYIANPASIDRETLDALKAKGVSKKHLSKASKRLMRPTARFSGDFDVVQDGSRLPFAVSKTRLQIVQVPNSGDFAKSDD